MLVAGTNNPKISVGFQRERLVFCLWHSIIGHLMDALPSDDSGAQAPFTSWLCQSQDLQSRRQRAFFCWEDTCDDEDGGSIHLKGEHGKKLSSSQEYLHGSLPLGTYLLLSLNLACFI